jgi:hypothetical protein
MDNVIQLNYPIPIDIRITKLQDKMGSESRDDDVLLLSFLKLQQQRNVRNLDRIQY